VNGVNSPCKECPDRCQLCWSKCEKYQAYKAKVDEIREREKKKYWKRLPIWGKDKWR